MNDLTLPPGVVLPADPDQAGCTAARVRLESCEHDCGTCAAVFEDTQGEVERLRANLWLEEDENYRLWQQLRVALTQTLDTLPPASRTAGPVHDEEFTRGWNRCVRETVRRVRELQKVL